MFGGIAMLLWWVLLILGIVVVVKWLIGASATRGRRSTSRAQEILEERYARGEIGKEELDNRKRELSD